MTIDNSKSLQHNLIEIHDKSSMWYVYIVQTRYGHWYTGITTNVANRIAAHQAGKGAKNLRGKGPLLLVYQQLVGNKSEASKLECQIKKLSKVKKEAFVASARDE